MVTEDERRRAAERLKKLRGLDCCKDPRHAVGLCSDAIGANHDNGYSWDKMLVRLADLIDPGDTSHGCRDTVACDRDALLALADDVDGAADDSGGFEPLAGMLRDITRRIREACGERAS